MSPAISFLTVYNLIIVSDGFLFHAVQELVVKKKEQNWNKDYQYIIVSFQLGGKSHMSVVTYLLYQYKNH